MDIFNREKEDINRELERAQNIINQEISSLEGTLLDWAYWDETYQFAQDKNPEYVANNLSQTSLRNIKIDLLAVYNQKGENIFNLKYNPKNQKYESSEEFATLLPSNYEMFQSSNPFNKSNGIIIVAEKPVLVAMAKILTSHSTGPDQGTLLFGRFLDEAFIEENNRIHNIQMSILVTDEKEMNSWHVSKWLTDDEEVINDTPLHTLKGLFLNPNEKLTAFYPIRALNTNHVTLVKVSKPREILQQGLISLRIILSSIIITTIIFILITYFSFNQLIITRILSIGKVINEITSNNAIHLRIPLQGKDEITTLSEFINNMLNNLEAAQKELSESEQRFRSFVTYSYDGIIIIDNEEKITLWNKSMEKFFSIPAEKVLGRPLVDVLWNYKPIKKTLGDLTYHRFKRRISAYFKSIQRKRFMRSVELKLIPENNNTIYIELTAFLIKTLEQPLYGIILRNITHRKTLEEKLNYISTHDALTKLYNRYFFDTELERFQDSRLFPISIILFDIDNLKVINDTYGHSYGDKILINFANILFHSFRSEDIIARIGGDEFAALLPKTNEEDAKGILLRVQANIEEYNRNISNLPLNMSAGLACAKKGDSLKEKLMYADMLMYQQKANKSSRLL